MEKLIRLLFPIAILIAIVSCDKDLDNYKSQGVIYGTDPRMCICCGGWLIQIDNSHYQFSEIPENSNFKLIYDSLPVTVKLDWQLIENSCSTISSDFKWIKILRIRKI